MAIPNFIDIINRLKASRLFRDSMNAILGNGLGNALMLSAGIVIARMLGKDLYGEYGLIKTTMLYVGVFASFGLGTTSTKFIATAINDQPITVNSIIKDTLFITVGFSTLISTLLFIFALPLANFLNDVDLVTPIRFLGPIIIANSINKAQYGILGGFKRYDIIAVNNVISALLMLIFACVFTYYWSLWGALSALLISQITNSILNNVSLRRIRRSLLNQHNLRNYKVLIKFSFPIALQDFSYILTHWGGSLLIVKFSSIGQLGIYTAASQWHSIVLMIPSLLVNVILSHLSSTVNNREKQVFLIKRLLIINFLCTFIPFIIIYIFAFTISKMYGGSFYGMTEVLRILAFSAIFMCCSNVFNSTLISREKNWELFLSRLFRDLLLLVGTYYFIIILGKEMGAIAYAISSLATSIIYFCIVSTLTFKTIR